MIPMNNRRRLDQDNRFRQRGALVGAVGFRGLLPAAAHATNKFGGGSAQSRSAR